MSAFDMYMLPCGKRTTPIWDWAWWHIWAALLASFPVSSGASDWENGKLTDIKGSRSSGYQSSLILLQHSGVWLSISKGNYNAPTMKNSWAIWSHIFIQVIDGALAIKEYSLSFEDQTIIGPTTLTVWIGKENWKKLLKQGNTDRLDLTHMSQRLHQSKWGLFLGGC